MNELPKVLVALMALLAFDGIWLGSVMRHFYKRELGDEMHDDPVWWALGIKYILLAFGITYLVLPLSSDGPFAAFSFGALLGLVVYGNYEFINHAVWKSFNLKLVFIGLLWGVFLCGTVSLISAYAASFM